MGADFAAHTMHVPRPSPFFHCAVENLCLPLASAQPTQCFGIGVGMLWQIENKAKIMGAN